MRSTGRIRALARYYKLITALEQELQRSFRAEAVSLDEIVRNVRAAYDAHVAHALYDSKSSTRLALLYLAVQAGGFAVKIDRNIDVARNVRALHATLNQVVAI
jgi:hypothetical protein